MYKRLIYLLLGLIAITSCKNKDSNANKESASGDIRINNTVDFTEPVFYQTLNGQIGGDSVVMHFYRQGELISANYYRKQSGPTVFLIKDWGQEDTDSIYLMEQRSNAEGLSPRWVLWLGKDTISGHWISADETTMEPVTLTAASNEQAPVFGAYSLSDSARYLKFKTDTPLLKTRVSVIQAIGDRPADEWINQSMKALLAGQISGNERPGSLQEAARMLVQKAVDGYEEEVDSSLVGVSNEAEVHYFLNREYINSMNLLYNQNDYLVVSHYNYAYTGGAHGNYGTTMRCYDIRAQKQLGLADILKADSVQLQTLLEQQYRQQYRVQPDTPLSEVLLVSHIAANDNFYFSSHGLGFSYVPYSLGPYAAGEIHIWLPFTILKPYLNAEFAGRMGI